MNIVGECEAADEKFGSDALSTGKLYVLGTEETPEALNSGYMFYDMVKSLLSGNESKMAAYRRKTEMGDRIARE